MRVIPGLFDTSKLLLDWSTGEDLHFHTRWLETYKSLYRREPVRYIQPTFHGGREVTTYNGTLCDSGYAIMYVVPKLSQPMPMDSCSVVFQVVGHMNDHYVKR